MRDYFIYNHKAEVIKCGLKEAVEDEVLPEPTVYLLPLTLDTTNYTYKVKKFGRDIITTQEGSTIVNNIMEIQRIKRETKTETCKEFAEKLKEKRWDAECRAGYVQVVDVGSIDEVLKEMEDN